MFCWTKILVCFVTLSISLKAAQAQIDVEAQAEPERASRVMFLASPLENSQYTWGMISVVSFFALPSIYYYMNRDGEYLNLKDLPINRDCIQSIFSSACIDSLERGCESKAVKKKAVEGSDNGQDASFQKDAHCMWSKNLNHLIVHMENLSNELYNQGCFQNIDLNASLQPFSCVDLDINHYPWAKCSEGIWESIQANRLDEISLLNSITYLFQKACEETHLPMKVPVLEK